jgi:cold-inducible RNA-binding protein
VKIFVGNLNFKTSEGTLQQLFSAHGAVDEVFIATDRETGRPRGFAFVTMSDDNQAKAAIEALNGQDVDGRTINVNEARPRTDGPRGGGFGGGGGGRGGFGGGGGGRGGFGGGGGGGRGGYGGGGGGRDRDSW